MSQNIKAFQIRVNGKTLDYRQGKGLNLKEVDAFFGKRYKVRSLYSGGRHVLGTLEKSQKVFFLKLATTEGISAVTQTEAAWNHAFNKEVKRSSSNFWVPVNSDQGFYKNNLFYLITDKFEGKFLSTWPKSPKVSSLLVENAEQIIEFSQIIQNLNIRNLKSHHNNQGDSSQKWFAGRTKLHFQSIPEQVKRKYNLGNLLKIVEKYTLSLNPKPRHGDFAPWHLIKLTSGQLGLIDGEHAMTRGVEGYDIAYFIQRVFCVLKDPQLAQQIFNLLTEKNYQANKLKVVLVARTIGGYLDESLTKNPDFSYVKKFNDWVINL